MYLTDCQEHTTERTMTSNPAPTRAGYVIGTIISIVAVVFGFAALFGLVR